MFQIKNEMMDHRTCRYWIQLDQQVVTFGDVLGLWQDSDGFFEVFDKTLVASPFEVFRWETPPLTATRQQRPFEFVLVNSPELADLPDRSTFAAQFRQANSDGIVQFENLGGDAILVVPAPLDETSRYAHLADFVRTAPRQQKRALWQVVGQRLQNCLDDQAIWLSTAGGGVAWLHVRLDSRPKYYTYSPYRNEHVVN